VRYKKNVMKAVLQSNRKQIGEKELKPVAYVFLIWAAKYVVGLSGLISGQNKGCGQCGLM
jgi:hypothetical protein